MTQDPIDSNPEFYRVVMENSRVRVLEYRDKPGDRTTSHVHPDSVMITLSAFKRRLVQGGHSVDVELEAGLTRWLDAQEHSGENTGTTPTHVMLVELKEPNPSHGDHMDPVTLGPSLPGDDAVGPGQPR
jgi:hypothetical protein